MGLRTSKQEQRKRAKSLDDTFVEEYPNDAAHSQTHQNLTNKYYGTRSDNGENGGGGGPPPLLQSLTGKRKVLRNVEDLRKMKDKNKSAQRSPLVSPSNAPKYHTPQLGELQSRGNGRRYFFWERKKLDKLNIENQNINYDELVQKEEQESKRVQNLEKNNQTRNKLFEQLGVSSPTKSYRRIPSPSVVSHTSQFSNKADRNHQSANNNGANQIQGEAHSQQFDLWSNSVDSRSVMSSRSGNSPRPLSKARRILSKQESFKSSRSGFSGRNLSQTPPQIVCKCQRGRIASFDAQDEANGNEKANLLMYDDTNQNAPSFEMKTNILPQIETNSPYDLASQDDSPLQYSSTSAEANSIKKQLSQDCTCSNSIGSFDYRTDSPEQITTNSDAYSIGPSSSNGQGSNQRAREQQIPDGWQYLNSYKLKFEDNSNSPERTTAETCEELIQQADNQGCVFRPSQHIQNQIEQNNNDLKAQSKQIRMRYLSKLTYHQVWLAPNQQPRSHQNLTIFDWDDTLLPTTFLLDSNVQESELEQLSVVHRKILFDIQLEVLALLEKFLKFGKVLIITNARKGWVEYSSAYLLPRVHRLITSQIPVISARSDFESKYPKDISSWKDASFKSLWDVDGLLIKDCLLNLMVIGDSKYEIDAGKQFKKTCKSKCVLKLMKLKEDPNPIELNKQLNVLNSQFEFITSSCKPLNLIIQSK